MADNRVSIQMIKDEVSMYDEYVEIPVPVGGRELTVKMYPYFKPEKVRDLVSSLTEFYQLCEKEKVTVPEIDQDDLIGYFIVKYFTDIKFSRSKKAKSIFEEFKVAQNSTLFKVLMETFPKESIYSVHDRIFDVLKVSAEYEANKEKYKNMIDELPLENKEIFKSLQNKLEVQ
ncbi:hypothetical protein [Bacillus infantis]|uniref:hypothetical protein n=1 Tax=Bacillus infantis TaxID=324767 RepID=UPI003CE978E3